MASEWVGLKAGKTAASTAARSAERLAEKKGFERAGMMDGPRAVRMAVGKVGWSVAKKAGSTAGRRVV